MSERHGMTRHTERYSHAPVRHPAVGDNTWFCHEDGDIVVDLELHDKSHDELDELKRQLHELTTSPVIPKEDIPSTTKPASGTTRNTSRVRVQEQP